MFRWLDLIIPIGTGLLSFGLCAWGALSATELPGIIISWATGAVFLASIPVWYWVRSSGLRPDCTAAYGVEIKFGKENTPNLAAINSWLHALVAFWSDHYERSVIEESLRGKLVVFRDRERLTIFGRYVRGYAFSSVAVIGYKPSLSYRASLFRHEVSHLVLGRTEGGDEKHHHDTFSDKKLGA